MDADTYREEIPALDKTRTVHHNALLTQVNILNRLAKLAGLPPFYDGWYPRSGPFAGRWPTPCWPSWNR